MGKDRLALLYLGQAVPMVAELSAAYPRDRPHVDEEEARVIDNTLWGVYNLIAFDLLSRLMFKAICRRLKLVLKPFFPECIRLLS